MEKLQASAFRAYEDEFGYRMVMDLALKWAERVEALAKAQAWESPSVLVSCHGPGVGQSQVQLQKKLAR